MDRAARRRNLIDEDSKPPPELEAGDPDWCLRGGYESWRLYQLAERSNWAVLPYAGGWLDQPQWWLDDVDMIIQQENYFDFWARQMRKEA